MAEINKSFRVNKGISLQDEVGLFYSKNDPSQDGEVAPAGSILLQKTEDGGTLWIKFGHDHMDWKRISDIELNDLDGINISSPAIGQVLMWNGAEFQNSYIDIDDLTGVSNHSQLTGLDNDDHIQYLLVNGSRSMTGDLDMGTNNITNVGTINGVQIESHASRHLTGGADEIDGDQIDIDWEPTNYTPSLIPSEVSNINHLSAHLYGIDQELGNTIGSIKKTIIAEFSLTEEFGATTKYFFNGRSSGFDSPLGKRSSANAGLQNANSCSPFQVPFDAKIVKAVLTVRGVGVQDGNPTYPVRYQTDLLSVGFISETKLADVNFEISNSFTVGTFTVGATDFKGSVVLNVDVNEGDMLGMMFQNGDGPSLAAHSKMAFITLVMQER